MTNLLRKPIRSQEFSVENIIKLAKTTVIKKKRTVIKLEYKK